MSSMILLQLAGGLALLIVGAEALVRGASRLAAAIGISPLIIGLTVVAFGTSAPELTVSIQSGLAGQADIALGNVVGSNIFNVLFILGLAATISPLLVSRQLIILDVPIMIVASIMMLILGLDGKLSRLEGVLLTLGIITYTLFLIHQSRKEKKPAQDEFAKEFSTRPSRSLRTWLLNLIFILAGLGMLVLGSRWLVESAIALAQALGVSELVIGLTIISAGTSLPEVATSVIAAFRGERDIAVGNVVGSNIFNILAVLGLSSLVSPNGIQVSAAARHFDIPVMIAVAVACLPVFFTGHSIARWEGLLFLGYYAAYTIYLIFYSLQHDRLEAFSSIMLEFIIPITIATLVVVTLRSWRRQSKKSAGQRNS